MQEKRRFQRALQSKFEFVSSLFLFVLKIFVCTVPPGTVLILIKFIFIVPNFWQLVVFWTCWILPKGLRFVENFPLRYQLLYIVFIAVLIVFDTQYCTHCIYQLLYIVFIAVLIVFDTQYCTHCIYQLLYIVFIAVFIVSNTQYCTHRDVLSFNKLDSSFD